MEIKASDVREFVDELLSAVWQCPRCHEIQFPNVIVEQDRNAIRTKEKCWVSEIDQWVCCQCYMNFGSYPAKHMSCDLYEFSKEE